VALRRAEFSIRSRLLAATALLLGVAALAPTAVLPELLERQARGELERRAVDVARAFAAASEAAIDFGDRPRATAVLGALASVEGARYGELRGSGDAVLAAWGAPPPNSPEPQEGAIVTYGTDVLHVVSPVVTPAGEHGVLRLGIALEELARRKNSSRRLVAITAVAVFLGGLLAAFLVTSLLTRPVRTLSALAARIAQGDEAAARGLRPGEGGEAGTVAEALGAVVGKLAAQRAMLQSQSEATSEGILTLGTEGQVITHNRRLGALWSLGDEDIETGWGALRRRLEERIKGSLPRWLTAPAPALGPATAEAFDLVTRDGRTLAVHAASVRTDAGEVLGLGLYFRDVTQRVKDRERIEELARNLERRVEERTREVAAANAELGRSLTELQRTQEQLVIADRRVSLGRLAAGVAHEINNPLAYLTANVQWVASELSESAGAPGSSASSASRVELCRALADAADGASRVAHIVRGLKQFSRGDEDARSTITLDRAVDAAIDMARHEIRHRASLERLPSGAPAVLANEVRLTQVILNLLINAAHAIAPGAPDRNAITVATGTESSGWAFVEIRDTGTGIAPEILGRIFDPFFTTKPQGEGSGLGLSISQGIVTSFGGAIEVESAPGRGSAFRVRLPPADLISVVPAPTPAAPRLARSRVLVVDDEPMVALALRRLLAREHEVQVAGDGEAALELFRRGERFDHVVCDLMMPVLNGMELHAALLREAPEQAARMVFITGGAFTDAGQAFCETLGARVVAKPIDLEQLRRAMHATSGE